MILCVTLNPCVDKAVYLPRLRMGEIQSASRVTITVGGKANNVARVLAAFGRPAVAMNFFGGETGRLCHRLLEEEDHVTAETIWTKAPTREIITIYEEERNRHTDIKEPGATITDEEREEFRRRYEALLSGAEFVSFGGSAPCASLDALPAELAAAASAAGVPFILDTYGKALQLGLKSRPFMVKPNRAEAEALFGRKLSSDADALEAVDELAKSAELAVLTFGEEGFIAVYEGRRYRVHSPKVRTVDAVGSGDALVAIVIMGIMDGKPFEETLAVAAAAGAANAAQVAACKIRPEDVAPLVGQAKVVRL